MVMEVRIRVNTKPLINALNLLKKEAGAKVMVRSLNKTAAFAKTAMSRMIVKEYNLKSAFVKDRLAVIKAKKSGSVAFTALLRGTGKRSANIIRFVEKSISLAQLKKRRKLADGKEIRFKIRKKGGLKTIDGSFIGNKGRTIFKRVEGTRGIKPVRTIDVPQMFNKKDINRAVQKIITNKFPQIFEREIKFALDKFNKSKA